MGVVDDFFAPMDMKNRKILLGNQILKTLEDLGCGFRGSRAILRGEIEATDLPTSVQEDLERYTELVVQVVAIEAEAAARYKEEELRVREARQSIESGNYTNADLEVVVRAGVAYRVYGDPDSNRPTHIEWVKPGNQYADQVGLEENPTGRR